MKSLLVVGLFVGAFGLPERLREKSVNSLRSSNAKKAEKKTQSEIKIVGGDPVDGSVYPWIGSMFVGDMDCGWHYGHTCGGSLIRAANPAVMLTAAHCLHGIGSLIAEFNDTLSFCSGNIYAAFGLDSVNNNSDYTVSNTIPAIEWVIHPDYDDDTFENDVGMIVFDGAVSGVTPVELYLNSETRCCEEGDDVTVIGYGTGNFEGQLTDYLEYVTLDYVSYHTCKDDWGSQLKRGMICAYRENKDSCQGDSGGPLILGYDMSDPQVGIVSYGYGCAEKYAGVYTDVRYYEEWIYDTFQQLVEDNGGEANAQLRANYNSSIATTEDPDWSTPKYNRFESIVFSCFLFLAILFHLV